MSLPAACSIRSATDSLILERPPLAYGERYPDFCPILYSTCSCVTPCGRFLKNSWNSSVSSSSGSGPSSIAGRYLNCLSGTPRSRRLPLDHILWYSRSASGSRSLCACRHTLSCSRSFSLSASALFSRLTRLAHALHQLCGYLTTCPSCHRLVFSEKLEIG